MSQQCLGCFTRIHLQHTNTLCTAGRIPISIVKGGQRNEITFLMSNLRHQSSKLHSSHSFLTVVLHTSMLSKTFHTIPQMSFSFPDFSQTSELDSEHIPRMCFLPQDPSGLWVLPVCSVCALGLPSKALTTFHCHFLLTHVCSV